MSLNAQKKALADAHDGPALITQTNGDIQYANAPLKQLLLSNTASQQPLNLFQLGTISPAGSPEELQAFIDSPGEELKISFQAPRYTNLGGLRFIIERSVKADDECVLLLGLPSRPVEAPHQADSTEPDAKSLESRVLKQTAKLAAQSAKRAKAEEQAKLEAERKVNLVANTVHHLNNPLNQIQGAFELVHREILTLHQTINDLLQPEEPDEDAETLRRSLDVQFKRAVENMSAIQSASHRMADTIDILRLVSGIDGWSFRETTVQEIAEAASRRLSSTLAPKLEALNQAHGSVRVLGHPVIYAQAIEEIERVIDRLGLESQEIVVRCNDDAQVLVWDPIEPYLRDTKPQSQRATTPLTSLSELTVLKREIEHLLQAYHVKLELTETGILLKVPNSHEQAVPTEHTGS